MIAARNSYLVEVERALNDFNNSSHDANAYDVFYYALVWAWNNVNARVALPSGNTKDFQQSYTPFLSSIKQVQNVAVKQAQSKMSKEAMAEWEKFSAVRRKWREYYALPKEQRTKVKSPNQPMEPYPQKTPQQEAEAINARLARNEQQSKLSKQAPQPNKNQATKAKLTTTNSIQHQKMSS